MSRTLGALLVLATGTSALACSAILGLQEPTVDNTIEGGTDSGGGDVVGPDVPNTCGADLQKDNKNCGACGHDCLGGDCSGGVCQPVVVVQSTSLAPYAMVLDGSTLYFTNIVLGSIASVWSVDKTATNGTPKQLADYSQGYTTPVVSGVPYSIAVENGFFYVSLYANGGSGAWEAGVDRCPTSGCTGKTLAYYGINSYAVAANSTNVFFGQYDFSDAISVQMANLDMTGRGSIATPASEVNGMAIDKTDLYYGTADGVFHCAGKTCDTASLVQGQALEADLLALDASNVYFTSAPFNGSATVQSVPRAGGPPKLISNKPQLPFAVATDGTDVYFTDLGDIQTPTTGAVYRCPVAGCNGQETLLSTGTAAGDNPRPIVVDTNAIYWGTRGGKIWRLAK